MVYIVRRSLLICLIEYDSRDIPTWDEEVSSDWLKYCEGLTRV